MGRKEIFDLLNSMDTISLTSREIIERQFYLKEFNKEYYTHKQFSRRLDMYYFRDSLFSITINPIAGGQGWINKNGFEYHWWNGAEAYATVGHWGFFVNLRDNHLSSELFSQSYLDQNSPGSVFKVADNGKTDFEEINGGVTYAWKSGHIGLLKDNFLWGPGYNGSNIFSGHTPSFVHLSLEINPVTWFRFNYVHGWLNSEIIDSSKTFNISGSYGTRYRYFYHNKFLAANMFSFNPLKKLSISLGNSIIYDFDQIHPAYLIPVMFFKAVDHNLTAGIQNMNSQMFLSISSKNIDKLHLYTSLFIDELSMRRITDKQQRNFASLKAGFRINNLLPDLFGGFEYTITNVLAFKHFVPTTTFESNNYNLGHYLTDNARELYASAGWKPFRAMIIQLSFTDVLKGPDHTLLGTKPREEIDPFVPVVFQEQTIRFDANYQIIHDLFIRFGFSHRKLTGDPFYLDLYAPVFWHGTTNNLELGINYGF